MHLLELLGALSRRSIQDFRMAPNWPTFPPNFPKYGLHRHTVHIGNSYILTITQLSEEQMDDIEHSIVEDTI